MHSRAKATPAQAVCCGLLLICAPAGHALDPAKALSQYHLDVWTEREGLPQGSVQAITQTSDGYLWIGTRDGLARFDGLTFTVFRTENTRGLLANDIRALCEDRAGQLWIGTFNSGLHRYANGEFTRYTMEDGLPSNGVRQLFADRQAAIWCGTPEGLARLSAGSLVVYGDNDGLPGRTGLALGEDEQGQVCVASRNGVHRFTGERFEILTEPGGSPSGPLQSVFADRAGTLWLVTTTGELWSVRDGKFNRAAVRAELPKAELRSVLQDRHTNLWLGTWGGLLRLSHNRLEVFSRAGGLPHDHVEVLFEDREGSLWVGTRGGGLARLSDGMVSNFTTHEGVADDFTKCVFEDRSGTLWVGTHGGGLSRYQAGAFANFTPEHGLPSLFIWSLAEDRQGDLWVGTARPASLCVFKAGRFISHGPPEDLPIEGGIRALCVDAENNVWLGGDGGGLCRFREGTFQCYTTTDGLPSDLIRAISQDREGNLWIGTTAGLCRFRDGEFTVFTTDDGLAHEVVYAIYEDADGRLWIGTQGGLTRYADGRFHSYALRDGLFQEVIYQILEDDAQNLWMSSHRGIFRVSKQNLADFDQGRVRALTCVAYGMADGMKSAQCEGAAQPAGWRSRDGKLWFPTANGVAMIDPSKLPQAREPLPVRIEQVLSEDRNLAAQASPDLPARTREVSFHYTALNFLAPQKLRFRYKLEGFDTDWIEAEHRRVAVYRDLPPGRYRFQVTARDLGGVRSEGTAAFAFQLLPPFYRTFWFYGLCATVLALAAWEFHRRRMRQAQARFTLLLAERNRIARDLHDTLAQGFAGIAFQLEAVATKLTQSPAQAQEHLNVALSMVRHSLAEARRSVMNLRSTALEGGGLPGALAETARQLVADKPIELTVQTTGESRSLGTDLEENLLRFGQEAITNAVKHAQASRIQIEIAYRDGKVLVSVRDNGRGFDPQSAELVNGAHFGLLGMRERAKQMDGQLRIQSAPGTGTEVTVEVPAH